VHDRLDDPIDPTGAQQQQRRTVAPTAERAALLAESLPGRHAVGLPEVLGAGGADHGLGQWPRRGDMTADAVRPSDPPCLRCGGRFDALLERGIVRNAGDDSGLVARLRELQGDERPPERDAAHEARRAVNRVDDPAPAAAAGLGSVFLAKDRIVAERGVDLLAEQVLNRPIGLRDRRAV